VNLVWAALIVAGVTVVAITAMLLGFVVFLAFKSFDTSRSGAKAEAAIVAQQFETAQPMPVAARARLSGELVCYARNLVYREWPRMESGSLGEGYNPWGVPCSHLEDCRAALGV
jgi:hypothetical protein